MPTITRALIKTGLLAMVLGMLLSALWLIHNVRPLHPLLSALQPTALHLIVVGWLTQLIIGVALWMFPVWSRSAPRGPEWLGWLCYATLNGGLALRLIAEPLNAYRPSALLDWLLVLAALLQVSAFGLFIGLIWPRVRARGTAR